MRKAAILAIIATSVALHAQTSPQNGNSYVAGRFVAYNYGLWSSQIYSLSATTGTMTVTLRSQFATLPDGRKIMPYNTNAPLLIGTETLTPSAVSGCTINDQRPNVCTVTVTATKTHSVSEQVVSGTFGLQEALNDAGGPSGVVVIDGSWAAAGGTTAIKNAATIPAATSIEDVRTGPPAARYLTGTTIVSGLPSAAGATGQFWGVTDGTSSTDCTTGGSTHAVVCESNGSAWSSVGGGGTPAGSTGNPQYNNAGVLGAIKTVYIPPSGDATCTNDTAAVNAAISAGATAVHLGTGTYYMDGLTFSSPFSMFGDGTGNTVIVKCGTTGYQFSLTWTTASSTITTAGTFRDFQVIQKTATTPTAGGFFFLSGSTPNYNFESRLEDILMVGGFEGVFVSSFVLNGHFDNLSCSALAAGGNACFHINDAIGGGNLKINNLQASGGGGASNGGIIIDQSDVTEISNFSTGAASIVFTQNATVQRVRIVNPNIEDSTSGCSIDFGTGSHSPTDIQIWGGLLGTSTANTLCNVANATRLVYAFIDTRSTPLFSISGPTWQGNFTGTGTISTTSADASSHLLNLTWTGGTTFSSPIHVLCPNITTASTTACSFTWGLADSINNSASVNWTNAGGSGSASNFASLSIFGKNQILNWFPNGGVSVGTTTTPSTNGLLVSGNINVASGSTFQINGVNRFIATPDGTATFTAGTNVTSCGCASGYTCTNTRGELTIVGGTATTGTICTVNFSTTLGSAPGMVIVTQNGGGSLFDVGHGQPSTSSFTITAGISVAASTVTVDYNTLQ